MANDESLILILNIGKHLFRAEKVLDDIISIGPKVLIVSGDRHIGKNNNNVSFLFDDIGLRSDIARSFMAIPVFHMLAFIQAAKKDIDPDRPKNLNFTTRI
jgi:glucosamine 6-phosphate synthetase-like amidotransferase/phosphosugar isomerase protein